ncbi:MAG: hypothetical protein ACP5G4_08765 [bacterium]
MKTHLLIIALIALAFAAVGFAEEAENGETNEIATLEEALSFGKPVAVIIHNTKVCDCTLKRCTAALELFQTAIEETPGDYISLTVDLAQTPDIGGMFSVKIVPTVIFFDSEGEEITRLQSLQIREEQLLEQLAALTETKTEEDGKETK